MNISQTLQKWFEINKRDLPWRKTNSPYHIWLSEVILQQTRVAQGLEYYCKFAARFPSVEDLAAASIDEILKLWQGLGYYTRARNLHKTAGYIANELKGVFPGTYNELLSLKGIGKYTAAAIASIAFREPVAVVDGNVIRVISRLFGIDQPIDSIQGKKWFLRQAGLILDKEYPDIHNQAVMELGALICLPGKPRCTICPLSAFCVSFKSGTTSLFPVRTAKKLRRQRYFNYFFIINGGYTWINKRSTHDIWHSLYEFPLIETSNKMVLKDIELLKDWKDIFGNAKIGQIGEVKNYKHILTHQLIHCSFYHLSISGRPELANKQLLRTHIHDLSRYAVPRLIEKYLSDVNPEMVI